MRFVLYGTYLPADHVVAVARWAEELGFDGLTLPDHVVHPAASDSAYPYPTRRAGDRAPWTEEMEWPDPLVAAAAALACTERLRIVTGIYVLPMRDPLLVAKAVATLDALTPGRFVLGVGVGWLREEFAALGQDFGTRGRRMDESIDVLRELLGGGRVEHHGRFFDFDELSMRPAAPALPIYAGGDSAPAIRRAAQRCDGLLPPLSSGPRTAEILAEIQRLRDEAGRTGPFELIAAAPTCATPGEIEGLAEAGATAVHVDPFALYVQRFGGLTLDQRRAALERYAAEVIGPYGG